MIITIDGPVASGKSTVAKVLAKRLNFYYLNSGFLYRSFAYIFLNKCNVKNLATHDYINDFPFPLDSFVYSYNQRRISVKFCDEDITAFLKTPEIDEAASIIAKNVFIRERILHIQRRIAKENKNLIADGRDCGSFVFANAELKIFLTASLEARALRWFKSQQRRSQNFTLEESRAFVKERDERDMNRAIAPLRPTSDAFIVDNTDIDIEQTVDIIVRHFLSIKTLP